MVDKETKYEEVDRKLMELIAWENVEKRVTPNLPQINVMQKREILKAWKAYLHNSKEHIKISQHICS